MLISFVIFKSFSSAFFLIDISPKIKSTTNFGMSVRKEYSQQSIYLLKQVRFQKPQKIALKVYKI